MEASRRAAAFSASVGRDALAHAKITPGITAMITETMEKTGGSRKIVSDGLFAAAESATNLAKKHPYAAAAVVTGAVVFGAPTLVTTPVLSAVGFTSQGVAGGSIAAGVQSGIGSVTAGSYFAVFQSAGAGGSAAAAIVNGAASSGGAVLSFLGVSSGLSSAGKAAAK